MPVVYYADSLLARLTPEIKHGRSLSQTDARASVERILSGDEEYIAAMRADQRSLAYKFSDEYCKAVWKRNLFDSGYQTALRQEGTAAMLWREFKRILLRAVAHELSSLPANHPSAMPIRAKLAN
jgi:hypothetical protein